MAEGFLPPIVAKLAADVRDFKAGMADARNELTQTAEHSKSTFDKMASAGKAATFAIGTAAVGIGALAVKQAIEGQKAHAQLVNALVQSGGTWKQYGEQIDKVSSGYAKWGFENDDVEKGLTRLTAATNDPKKAITSLSVAADLARARHMDLESASTLVGKVMAGNTTILGRYGISLDLAKGGAKAVAAANTELAKANQDLGDVEARVSDGRLKGVAAAEALRDAHAKVEAAQKKVTDASNAGDQALNALSQRFGGAAARESRTFAGQLQAVEAQAKNMLETLGTKLIPIIQKLITVVMNVVQWLKEHKTVALALAVVVGGALAAVIAAYIISMITAAAATIAATWPILAIIVAVAALVAAGLWLVDNWQKVWDMIKDAVGAVLDWLKQNWDIVLTILTGPIGLAVLVIRRYGDDILNFFTGLPGQILGALGDLGGLLVGAGHALLDGLAGGAKAAWNAFVGFWNGIQIHVPGIHIPLVGTVGGFTVGLPDLPYLAGGAVIRAGNPMLAVVGDNPTQDEIVTPEDKMRSIVRSELRGADGGGGGVTIIIVRDWKDAERLLPKESRAEARAAFLQGRKAS